LPSDFTSFYLARLLTSGIKPVFFSFPFSQWQHTKTDISGYSGGTVTDLHRVPFAKATLKFKRIYKILYLRSTFKFTFKKSLAQPLNPSI
jgi:hypothetical protein